VIWAVVVWGAAIVAFGVMTLLAPLTALAFPLALGCMALAGGADVLSAVFRTTLVQLSTPDELRGRITGLHFLAVRSGPLVGDIEAAAVAAVIGPQLSALSGGLLCLVGVVAVARAYPELARHRTLVHGTPEHATP
jgi:hypothetical protein